MDGLSDEVVAALNDLHAMAKMWALFIPGVEDGHEFAHGIVLLAALYPEEQIREFAGRIEKEAQARLERYAVAHPH